MRLFRRAIRESPLQNSRLGPWQRGGLVKAMAAKSNGQRHKRRSIRLPGYDYSQAGAYYITVCTRDRKCLFGHLADGQMQLNDFGQVVQSVWVGLRQFCQDIELDAFVIMPNHIHGVIAIHDPVGAIHESPSHARQGVQGRRMLLSKIVGRLKMVSAKQINALCGSPGQPLWQRNYYEHIVRDEEALNRIRQYIADNPAQWEFDHENPAGSASERTGDS